MRTNSTAFLFAAETASPASPHPLSAHSGSAVSAGICASEKCPSSCWFARRNFTPFATESSIAPPSANADAPHRAAATATAIVVFFMPGLAFPLLS